MSTSSGRNDTSKNTEDHGVLSSADAAHQDSKAASSTTITEHADLNKVVAPGILLFIDQILIAAGAWIFWIVISKLATTSEIGIATAFYSLAMLATTAAQLGFEYPLLKRSSSERSKIFGTVIALEMIITALSIPILLYVASIMYGQESTAEYIWLTVGILVLTSLGFVSRFALLGISDANNVLIFDMAGTGLKFAVGFLLVAQGYGGIGILVAFVAHNAIIAAGTIAIAKKKLRLRLGPMLYAKEILTEGLANLPSKLSKMFIVNLSIVLLALLGATGSSDIGVFYIELMICLAVGSLASSIAYMIIPASAARGANSDASNAGIRIALSLTAIIVASLLVAPEFFLSLIGPNYSSEGTSFFILCLSIIPGAILNSTVARLNTSNKLRALVFIGSVQIITFLLAFFVLSPIYGLIGAAISILTAFSVAALLSLVWSHDRSYLRSIAFPSFAVAIGSLAGYLLSVLAISQSPIVMILVSAPVTTAVLFATKSVSLSDIRVILRVGSAMINHSPADEDGSWNTTVRKAKSYLMLGNYGNFNIGDETLLKAIIKDVRRNDGEGIEFLIPTRNPSFVHVYHNNDSHLIEPLPINAPSLILRAFIKSHAIIVGGGGIWSGYTGPLAHFIPIVTIIGKLVGKKVEFRAIGLYSTAHMVDRLFVNLAISLADSCSVRDEESYKLLWRINKRKAKKVDDLAIQYLREISPEELANIPIQSNVKKSLSSLKESDKIVVGISVKPVKSRKTNEKVISQFSAAIDTLNFKYPDKLHFVFFPFSKTNSKVESDEDLVKDIGDQVLKGDYNITALDHSDPLSWFIAIRDYVDVFVGMRFHSIIFASEARKPILCIPYEKKIIEFLKSKNADSGISTIPPEDLESSSIVDFVDYYMKMIALGRGKHEN